MSDTRCLFRPDHVTAPPGNGAPRAIGREGTEARFRIGEFLDAALMRPLYFDEAQQQQRVEHSLDTMTQAERVYLEIEMMDRATIMHSFDYDALR